MKGTGWGGGEIEEWEFQLHCRVLTPKPHHAATQWAVETIKETDDLTTLYFNVRTGPHRGARV